MRFEFDPTKSAANKVKHGIGFIEAPAITVTYRHEETIRLLSVRRARANEKKAYFRI